LANAAARQAIDSLDRCIAAHLAEEVETDGAGFRALGAHTMTERLFGIPRHQVLEFGLGLLMFQMRGFSSIASAFAIACSMSSNARLSWSG
jgi:hypothetical protein